MFCFYLLKLIWKINDLKLLCISSSLFVCTLIYDTFRYVNEWFSCCPKNEIKINLVWYEPVIFSCHTAVISELYNNSEVFLYWEKRKRKNAVLSFQAPFYIQKRTHIIGHSLAMVAIYS